MINKVKLFLGAQDIRGLPLSTKELYIIIATGFCYSVIEDQNSTGFCYSVIEDQNS